jgi:hypothetical protein
MQAMTTAKTAGPAAASLFECRNPADTMEARQYRTEGHFHSTPRTSLFLTTGDGWLGALWRFRTDELLFSPVTDLLQQGPASKTYAFDSCLIATLCISVSARDQDTAVEMPTTWFGTLVHQHATAKKFGVRGINIG